MKKINKPFMMNKFVFTAFCDVNKNSVLNAILNGMQADRITEQINITKRGNVILSFGGFNRFFNGLYNYWFFHWLNDTPATYLEYLYKEDGHDKNTLNIEIS